MAKIGRSYSLATSYDIAFLHSVMAALENAPVVRLRCTALPLRKVAVRRLSEDNQRWLSAINLLLLTAKCEDDIADDSSWKGHLGHRLLAGEAKAAHEFLHADGFPVQILQDLPERQARAERALSPTPEALALPTAEVLGSIFAAVSRRTGAPSRVVALRQLGQSLGSAIYLKDALDDQAKDRRKNRFNAITACANTSGRPYVRQALAREVERARRGVIALKTGTSNTALTQLLDSLLPASEEPSPTLEIGRWGRRRQSGVWEIAACWKGLGLCGVCCEGCGHGAHGLSCGECCSACPCPVDCCSGSQSGGEANKGTTTTPTAPRPSLHCPACEHQLSAVMCGQVEVDECRRCSGLWLDHGELEALAALETPPNRLLTSKTLREPQMRPEGTRPCPHCAEFLTVMVVKGTRLEVCPSCKGLWLDQGELNQLLDS